MKTPIIPDDLFLRKLREAAKELGWDARRTETDYEIINSDNLVVYARPGFEAVAAWLSIIKIARSFDG